ncbi:MAG: hypothetical protein K6T85_09855 [Gorillibacterium sp.]|nr:hypothetical protein [Gorillibacterium sp.]
MTKCFILNDIGFDFWGMSWDRAMSLANYNEENTSVIADAKIIYYASAEDLEKFTQLRTIGDTISPNFYGNIYVDESKYKRYNIWILQTIF